MKRQKKLLSCYENSDRSQPANVGTEKRPQRIQNTNAALQPLLDQNPVPPQLAVNSSSLLHRPHNRDRVLHAVQFETEAEYDYDSDEDAKMSKDSDRKDEASSS